MNVYLALSCLFSIAVIQYRPAWIFIRHGVTLIHEVGHAVFGLLSGASLNGIILRTDASGVTTTGHSLNNYWLSRFITLGAGYPAPAFFGAAAVTCAYIEQAQYGWGMLTFMGALCFAFSRSLFTVFVSLVFTAISATLTFVDIPAEVSTVFLGLFGGLLVFGGIKSLAGLTKQTRHGDSEGSDPRALGELTHISHWFWLFMMWVYTFCGIGLAAYGVIMLENVLNNT